MKDIYCELFSQFTEIKSQENKDWGNDYQEPMMKRSASAWIRVQKRPYAKVNSIDFISFIYLTFIYAHAVPNVTIYCVILWVYFVSSTTCGYAPGSSQVEDWAKHPDQWLNLLI